MNEPDDRPEFDELWVEGISPSGVWVPVEPVSLVEASVIAQTRDPRKYRVVHKVRKITWGGVPGD